MKALRVFEIGEANLNPSKYYLEKYDNGYKYRFKTEKEEYEVFLIKRKFGEKKNEYFYTLDFRKFGDNENKLINKGDVYQVLTTIVDIVNKFIDSKDPKRILIYPKQDKKDFRRFNIFKRFIDKNLRKDWETNIVNIDGKKNILLKNKNRFNK